jgi:putative toxin-antitoxin system antitoxin component (TIGR02293 family)
MSATTKKAATEEISQAIHKVAELLGGKRILSHQIYNALDAHELLERGLPAHALDYLMGHLTVLDKTDSLEKAVGISVRTYQRRKDAPSKPLSLEQSGRTWKFAEILTKTTDIFGSQEEAEAWLERPAIGLDQRRPIDLLSTPTGVELVEDYLTRLQYGVYT